MQSPRCVLIPTQGHTGATGAPRPSVVSICRRWAGSLPDRARSSGSQGRASRAPGRVPLGDASDECEPFFGFAQDFVQIGCRAIRFVGNYQLQAGRPSGSGAKVRHGMRGQCYVRLNLDFHAMTEAPESQTHVVNRVGWVLRHGPIIVDAPAQKIKSPDRMAPGRGSSWLSHNGRVAPTIGQLGMFIMAVKQPKFWQQQHAVTCSGLALPPVRALHLSLEPTILSILQSVVIGRGKASGASIDPRLLTNLRSTNTGISVCRRYTCAWYTAF